MLYHAKHLYLPPFPVKPAVFWHTARMFLINHEARSYLLLVDYMRIMDTTVRPNKIIMFYYVVLDLSMTLHEQVDYKLKMFAILSNFQ